AMYAGMIAKVLIEKKVRIPVQCIVASEYRYMDPIFQEDTLLILISQSGETADTLAALHLAKQHHVPTLAIVNVENSALAREADYVLYTHAGVEISVATTKAYCTQVALLSLIACHLSYIHGYIDDEEEKQLLDEFKQLPILMDKLIHQDVYKEIATHLYQKEHVFLMGRGLDYALSMEGALKLKEISYIHCEAYAAGELKHGTISLIEKDTPIIVLCSDDSIYEKTMSNMKEVKARGAKIIVLATEDLPIAPDTYDVRLTIPKTDILLQGILTVIPLQLIAYETANMRGCEIDQPRNLAKSVTVE
ncbi:MAG: isomerizing glutamine--fructose-6-phosphate transaminase, partial [Erysipelotrichaceae bacterium]|nr:isomerizing glutamine--fructose-6-phosphate transaminase [Erysipelotrichaceae bacterium]